GLQAPSGGCLEQCKTPNRELIHSAVRGHGKDVHRAVSQSILPLSETCLRSRLWHLILFDFFSSQHSETLSLGCHTFPTYGCQGQRVVESVPHRAGACHADAYQ